MINSIIDYIIKHIYPLRLTNNHRAIIVTGSPRSGTTFLAETIAESLSCVIIWEPLQDKVLRRYNISINKRPTKNDLDGNNIVKYLNGIVEGKYYNYYNLWLKNIKYRKKLKYWHKYDTIIIKFTRGNGIIDYYNNNNKVATTLSIIRNPYSVIASQIEHHEYKEHPIYSNHSSNINKIIGVIESVEQSIVRDLAITWSIDYINAKTSKSSLIVYDDIYNDTKKYKSTLSKYIPQIKDITISKSSTYNNKTADKGRYDNKWKKTLNEKDIEAINVVIKMLGIEKEVYEDFNITI